MNVETPLTILYKGGRLPSWHRLPAAEKEAAEQQHVDLMLSVAAEYGLARLDGHRLLAPQGEWGYFWLIEFPTLAGAEAWMTAEVAPPYGRHGFYEYQLARPLPLPDHVSLSHPSFQAEPLPGDPHQIPPLDVDRSRVIAFVFEVDRPGTSLATRLPVSGFPLSRLEGYRLLTSQAGWQRLWLAELPDLAAAEAWVTAAATGGRADDTARTFHLARPWAPAYFAGWLADR